MAQKRGSTMSLDQLANIAEISAAALLIVSLIYVGIQIKQNTKATQISTSQTFVDTFSKAVLEISRGKEFTDIYWRGLSGLSNLRGSETAAFGAWAINIFRIWESCYFQWRDGVLDDRLWTGWEAQFRDLFGYPGIREMWSVRRHQFNEEFREYADQQIVSAEAKPLYVSHEAQT
jgi:hypothetical protein